MLHTVILQQITEASLLQIHPDMKNIQETWQWCASFADLAVILVDASQGVLVTDKTSCKNLRIDGNPLLCICSKQNGSY